ncbi:MAG: phosphoribosylglycinamide formyltransferase [Clostridia bacterium]|nr:phosphoribosylglycinamide formyltransferase [Clostridia bacterium]MBR3296170.1 phosphoribosylglycinamide formyltransferase [Clostridia bacterium]
MTNICVFVSGGGTNLQALIDAQKSGIIKSGRISLVISDKKDAYALVRAKENGIKTRVLIKKKAESKDEYEDRIEAVLRENDIDLIVLAGFMRILSGRFTGRHKNRIINVHPALIPSFCGEGFYGLKVHEAALAYGVKVSGATVHFVNEVPDGGQIIYQKAVEVQDGDTPEILQKRIMEQAEWILLPKACELVSHKIQTGEL